MFDLQSSGSMLNNVAGYDLCYVNELEGGDMVPQRGLSAQQYQGENEKHARE